MPLRSLLLLSMMAVVVLAINPATLQALDNPEREASASGGSASEEPEKESEADQSPVMSVSDEIVVTATRKKKNLYDAPSSASIVSEKKVEESLSRSLPEALATVPSVMVQKTAYGQGSPYIRGFTGFHNLMLVDGIRLNNSVFRSGPNQYWNTVDHLLTNRLEVVRGPSSVLYGSDAVGGVVNLITRSREEYEPEFDLGGELFFRWSEAENSFTERLQLEGNAGEKFGWLGGITLKDYGDLTAGQHTRKQEYTGYDELDGDLKVDFALSDATSLTMAWQRVSQDEVPRTHKTIHAVPFHGTTVGKELRRELDQDRELIYGRLTMDDFPGIFDRATFTLSSCEQNQERDRLRTGQRQDISGFDVQTYGASMQFELDSMLGDWTFGAEAYRDNVDSFRRNYVAGVSTGDDIQGPVGDRAEQSQLGIYIQNEKSFGDLDLITGVRYNRSSTRADRVEDPVTALPMSVKERSGAMVGSLRAVYHLNDFWNLFGGVSQGFRSPNLMDLTSLDDTSAVEIPSPHLDPEYFTAFEVGVRTRVNRVEAQAAIWRTQIDDMIVQSPTNRPGPTQVVRKDNVGDGYIHGIDAEVAWNFRDSWTALCGFTWMNGKVDQLNEDLNYKIVDEPVSRMMPFSGFTALRYEPPESDYWALFETIISDEQDKLALRDVGDTSRIPEGGTPRYTVYNLRAGWDLTEDLSMVAALENITNKNYRVHGSGINEAGRNLVLSFRLRF